MTIGELIAKLSKFEDLTMKVQIGINYHGEYVCSDILQIEKLEELDAEQDTFYIELSGKDED